MPKKPKWKSGPAISSINREMKRRSLLEREDLSLLNLLLIKSSVMITVLWDLQETLSFSTIKLPQLPQVPVQVPKPLSIRRTRQTFSSMPSQAQGLQVSAQAQKKPKKEYQCRKYSNLWSHLTLSWILKTDTYLKIT